MRSGGTWFQQGELTAANHAGDDEFGASVALAGPTAVVGAPAKNSFAGEAYVFANI